MSTDPDATPDAERPSAGGSVPAADTARAEPDAAKSEASTSDAPKPDAAKPDAAKPAVAKPDAAKPAVAKPDVATEPADDEPVAKIPYARGLRLSRPEMFRIAMFGSLLVAVIILAKPCSESVSKFVTSFDTGSGKGSQMPKPGTVTVPQHLEPIGSNLTLEQYRDLVKRSEAMQNGSGAAASGQGSGSAEQGSASAAPPSGSAASTSGGHTNADGAR